MQPLFERLDAELDESERDVCATCSSFSRFDEETIKTLRRDCGICPEIRDAHCDGVVIDPETARCCDGEMWSSAWAR